MLCNENSYYLLMIKVSHL